MKFKTGRITKVQQMYRLSSVYILSPSHALQKYFKPIQEMLSIHRPINRLNFLTKKRE